MNFQKRFSCLIIISLFTLSVMSCAGFERENQLGDSDCQSNDGCNELNDNKKALAVKAGMMSDKEKKLGPHMELHQQYNYYAQRNGKKISPEEFVKVIHASNIFLKDSFVEHAAERMHLKNKTFSVRSLVDKVYSNLNNLQIKEIAWWLHAERNIKEILLGESGKGNYPISPRALVKLNTFEL